jgi:GNAT superfamily N-acetyltransferase
MANGRPAAGIGSAARRRPVVTVPRARSAHCERFCSLCFRRLKAFDCGDPSLNDWLRKRALANQAEGASRTYVVTDGERIAGYYLAAGGINVAAAPGRSRRNMPNPIPVALLGRMAVDRSYQGKGLGRAMFRDGAKRIIHAADTLGIRGLIAHAISEEAKAFYLALGFEPSPLEPMTLMVTLADLRRAL